MNEIENISNLNFELKRTKAIDFTKKYSTSLLLIHDNNIDIQVGSGTFVILWGKKGILTNHHVANLFFSNMYYPNDITFPYNASDLRNLRFETIIMLPQKYNNDIDMAFIMLDEQSCKLLAGSENNFFDLDVACEEKWILADFKIDSKENSIWLAHGSVAEGMEIDIEYDPYRSVLKGPFVGPYVVNPDLDKIEYVECDYERFKFKADLISCYIDTKLNQKLPKSFKGISGSALWQINFDNKDEIEKVFLSGIVTEAVPPLKSEKLVCRGTTALYKSFYLFCSQKIKENY